MKTYRQLMIMLFVAAFTSISGAAQQPTEQTMKAAPAAYALLKSAHAARETFPQNFAGFTAELTFNDNGRVSKGTVAYADAKGAEMKVEGLSEEATEWLQNQLNSLLAHRRNGDFAKGDGRHSITFGDDDKSPLGRLVQLNDSMKSSYRVRDNKTVEVTRTMMGERFTITVLDTTPTEGGKFLPRNFVVTYFDAKTGALKRTDMFSDVYARNGKIWMPVSRRIVKAENGQLTTRIIEISNPKMTAAAEAAGK